MKNEKSVTVQPVVGPRTIALSENVSQKEPLAFMVFAYDSADTDYTIFTEEVDARDYAMDQEEKANAPEESWPIYALWASDWPREKSDRPQ